MAKYRKKPVVIEAVQFEGVEWLKNRLDSAHGNLPTWLLAALSLEEYKIGAARLSDEGLLIVTLEGLHLASQGDWIIQGVKGELYPCKPDIFEATYDPT